MLVRQVQNTSKNIYSAVISGNKSARAHCMYKPNLPRLLRILFGGVSHTRNDERDGLSESSTCVHVIHISQHSYTSTFEEKSKNLNAGDAVEFSVSVGSNTH